MASAGKPACEQDPSRRSITSLRLLPTVGYSEVAHSSGNRKVAHTRDEERDMDALIVAAKGGGGKGAGGQGGKAAPNPNWPSRTGNPSGGDRGNNPPKK